MHQIRKLLKFFIYSNLLISCCAVAFLLTGKELLQVEVKEVKPLALIFSATFLIYNLNIFLVYQLRKKRVSGRKMDWFFRNRHVIYILLLLNTGLLLWSFPYGSWQQSLFFLHLGIISLLYNVPDRYANTAFRSIRSVPLIKVFLIAYVWAAIGAFYPALEYQQAFQEAIILFVLFFLFILAITLPFDIRDYYGDKKRSLLTVPGVIGIKNTRKVAVALLLLYAIGIGFIYQHWAASFFIALTGGALIAFSSEKRPDWYYTGGVDSLLLLQYLLMLVL